MKLTSHEICQASGATYRQIDHWTTIGALMAIHDPNPGSGFPRQYDPSEAVVACVLAAYSEGFSPSGRGLAPAARHDFTTIGAEVRRSIHTRTNRIHLPADPEGVLTVTINIKAARAYVDSFLAVLA